MRNVLFVLYGDAMGNSAVHTMAMARELEKLGHVCVVGVTQRSPRDGEAARGVRLREHSSLLGGDYGFPNGAPPDIVHGWTPREAVRLVCERVVAATGAALFVHLEDNEQLIARTFLGRSEAELGRMSMHELDEIVPPTLSHPLRSRAFLESACGVTVLLDRLAEHVPDGVPTREWWPSADEAVFVPRPVDVALRAALGIALNARVLVYHGNVHPANAAEVRSLYLAVALLNREGLPVTLVRAGKDFAAFLGPDERWARRHEIALGYVGRDRIATILALADYFVQPGEPGEFNDFRFPSKVPEFLAMARPTIVPATNIGLQMRSGIDALVLPSCDAVSIFQAIRRLEADEAVRARLARGARAFFEERLRWRIAAQRVAGFYDELGVNAREPETAKLSSVT